MSRGRGLLVACAAAPWLLALVWNALDRRDHLLDRAIRTVTVWRD